jgi:acetoin utilization protein AcuC
MERIQHGFEPGGDLLPHLDASTQFRIPGAQDSIRLRSWAIHDGILGEPFTDVTMYKDIEKPAGLNSSLNCGW